MRRWIVGLVVVLIGGGALYAEHRYGIADIYVQDFVGAGIHLRIPHRYDISANGTVVHFLALKIPYPELVLRNKDSGLQDASQPAAEPLDHIFIELRISASTRIEDVFAKKLQGVSPFESQLQIGLDTYRVYNKGSTTDYQEYMVSQARPEGQGRTTMNCGAYVGGRLNKYLWDFCYAYVQYTDRLYVIYHLPRRALDDWRSIEADVLAYLRSVTVDCFESDPSSHEISRMRFQACSD